MFEFTIDIIMALLIIEILKRYYNSPRGNWIKKILFWIFDDYEWK